MKVSKIIVATALLSLATAGSAFAFHDGGVATCDGCHTMHNSKGNKVMNKVAGKGSQVIGTANNYLLQGSDQSSTCLGCHGGTTGGGYKVMTTNAAAGTTVVKQFTPGGDFGWLLADYSWTSPRNGTSPKDRHGHNVVAADFGIAPDATLLTAPGNGSTFVNTDLACSSCHDPHARYRTDTAGVQTLGGAPIAGSGSYGDVATAGEARGTYRFLAGVGYKADSQTTAGTFAAPAPVAVAPAVYNQTEAAGNIRVAYGTGMSEWCSNCHVGLHNSSYPTNLRHPAGDGATLTASVLGNYNAYVMTGNLTATAINSYDSLIPFGTQAANVTALKALVNTANVAGTASNNDASTAGADASSTVICLSCHRAHASGFTQMGRWNFNAEFMTVDGAYADASKPYVATDETTYGNYADGKTAVELAAAYNGKPATHFASFQRQLCNKCHAKD